MFVERIFIFTLSIAAFGTLSSTLEIPFNVSHFCIEKQDKYIAISRMSIRFLYELLSFEKHNNSNANMSIINSSKMHSNVST